MLCCESLRDNHVSDVTVIGYQGASIMSTMRRAVC
jgi:hypothetical protein